MKSIGIGIHFIQKQKKQKNSSALKYAEWWKSRQQNDNNMLIGKAFSTCRRVNTHKRPTYKIGFDAKIESGESETQPDESIKSSIKIIPKAFLQVEGFEQMSVENACTTYLSTIEKFSNDHYEIIEKIEREELKL